MINSEKVDNSYRMVTVAHITEKILYNSDFVSFYQRFSKHILLGTTKLKLTILLKIFS